VKLESSGAVSWQTMIGGNGWDEAHSIEQTDDGGYVVAGYSSSTDIPGQSNLGELQLDAESDFTMAMAVVSVHHVRRSKIRLPTIVCFSFTRFPHDIPGEDYKPAQWLNVSAYPRMAP
jgi:hypothetical protein